MLEEQLAYVKAVRDNHAYDGTRYSLGSFDIQPRPVGRLKLLVGGAGPRKTPRLAGLYADEFNAYARPVEVLRERIETARGIAVAAGRDPDDLMISTACVPVVGRNQAEYEVALADAADVFSTPIDGLEQRLAGAGILLGTPPQVAETLAAWSELGVARYYVQRPGQTDEERVRLFELVEAALG
jgi:alkanesulfonate monooxygenase SsuD/methylene tetrahydromethanopterin reductase-like flavin-dependent oxidoreductase (luciferase family)